MHVDKYADVDSLLSALDLWHADLEKVGTVSFMLTHLASMQLLHLNLPMTKTLLTCSISADSHQLLC